jgi:hypothetical protein
MRGGSSGQRELLVFEHQKLKAPKVVIVRSDEKLSDAPKVLGAAKNRVRATLQTVTIPSHHR